MDVSNLTAKLKQLEANLISKKAVRDRLNKDLISLSTKATVVDIAIVDHTEAATVLQKISQSQQAFLQGKLESLVSYALTTIFGKTYQFQAVFDVRGNQTELSFKVADENGNFQDLKRSHGGGLISVVAFLLRVIVLLSVGSEYRRLLVLDEPFVQLSEEYLPAFTGFLKDFTKQADLQIVMITHNEELRSVGDKVYKFRNINGETKVEVI
jgi:DNA repair exonuclease SbcCD ATPase subunit